MRLKDKVAIITGGSRGIGYATADKFLSEGAKVILTASTQESADQAVASLQEKYPNRKIMGISPNLANYKEVEDAFVIATAQFGCVDVLVNNAGVSERTPFMEYTEETFDKVMDLNVKGVYNATRADRTLVALYLEPGFFSERCTERLSLRVDFIHRVEFGEVSGHRVLIKRGPGNRGPTECGTTHEATSGMSS